MHSNSTRQTPTYIARLRFSGRLDSFKQRSTVRRDLEMVCQDRMLCLPRLSEKRLPRLLISLVTRCFGALECCSGSSLVQSRLWGSPCQAGFWVSVIHHSSGLMRHGCFLDSFVVLLRCVKRTLTAGEGDGRVTRDWGERSRPSQRFFLLTRVDLPSSVDLPSVLGL